MKRLLATLLLVSSPAFSLTGNDALELFTGSESKSLRLEIYANGVIDAESAVHANAQVAARASNRYIRPFCMPRGATISQAAMIIENQLRLKPENNHLNLYIVARRALLDAWPCTDQQVLSPD